MATEAIPRTVHEDLLNLDQQLHAILSQWSGESSGTTLQELQEHIKRCLPEEMEDSTEVIQELRKKKYDY